MEPNEGLGGEQTTVEGDAQEDTAKASEMEQLPSLPPMTGQSGNALIIPIKQSKTPVQ
jgi:hypothetical protein